MAEHLKDENDRVLEAMFASDPINDDGFTASVVRRVRRKILVRRSALPVATLFGGALVFKPIAGIVELAYGMLQQMPDEFVASISASLPTLQLLVTGGLVLGAAIMSLSMLED